MTFRYNRTPTGELPGNSLVVQTEAALSALSVEATEAKEAAQAAETAAEDASSAAGAAASSAAASQAAAEAAAQSAAAGEQALVIANRAETTAQQAVTASTAASTAAQAAQTEAENAASDAQDAADAASVAATDAQTARGAASAAQTAAETAQADADNASGLATQAQAAAAQSAQDAQAAAASVAASARQIGEIISSALPLNSAGLHLLDGALLDGSGIYADFVDYIAGLYTADPTAAYFTDETTWQSSITNYGVCSKFVYDSVNSTVRLPKLTGIVEGTTDLTALGDLIQAGLPNLYGATFLASSQNYATKIVLRDGGGVFDSGNSHSNIMSASNSGDNTQQDHLIFNANKYNPIYGNSTTVQPQTIKVLFYIVVATVTKTDIQVNIDNVVTELNRLNSHTVQTDYQALTDAQKAQARANIAPSIEELTIEYVSNVYFTQSEIERCFAFRYGNIMTLQINATATAGQTTSDLVTVAKIKNVTLASPKGFLLRANAVSQNGHQWIVQLTNDNGVLIKIYSVGTSTAERIGLDFTEIIS